MQHGDVPRLQNNLLYCVGNYLKNLKKSNVRCDVVYCCIIYGILNEMSTTANFYIKIATKLNNSKMAKKKRC